MEIVKYALAVAWFAWPYAAVAYAIRHFFPKLPPPWLILLAIVGGFSVWFAMMAVLLGFGLGD